MPMVSQAMSKALTRIDQDVSTDTITQMEADGWNAPVAFVGVRIWVQSIAAYHGRCQALLLSCWVRKLTDTITSSKSRLPSWEACCSCSTGEFDLQMASGLLCKKDAAVIKEHNRLHEFMPEMGRSSCDARVPPQPVPEGSGFLIGN